MRPIGSTKKPLELGIPSLEKKAPHHKQINETDTSRKLASSQSTRLLNNLTSNPLSRRVGSPVNLGRANSPQRNAEKTSLSPKDSKQNLETTQAKPMKKQNDKLEKQFRAFGDEEEVKVAKDFSLKVEEYQGVPSTKCTDKESDSGSVNEEDEKERERLMDQLGLYGVRRGQRGTLKHKEMFEHLNGSFNQDERRSSTKTISKPRLSEKDDFDNKQSSNSTLKIAESPLQPQKTREDDFNTRNSETESGEQSFDKPEDRVVLSDIWNDTPRADKSAELRMGKGKSKINFEIYLTIENLLRGAKEALSGEESMLEIFGEYINTVSKKDSECFEKIFRNENESRVIKSSFVLERLCLVLALYFTEELKLEKDVEMQIKRLVDIAYENCILFGYLLLQRIKEDSTDNTLIDKLLEVLENEEAITSDQKKNLDKIHKNNIILSNSMKNMIMMLQNKELMYGYNSIVVQSDRISPKEAYSRMLKCISVYTSEQELKGQDQKLKASIRKRGIEKTPKGQKAAESVRELEADKSKEVKKNQKEETVSYYLPKMSGDKKYTLVLDLDETLVHYAEIPGEHNELRVRPYAEYFLTEVSKYYEIVVFTTGIQEYADWVLDNIDKHLSVSYRLYRHHATVDPDTASFIKDLSRLGRELTQILIVDNLPENFRLQPDNGIAIKPWYDDHEDNALYELAPLLIEIAKRNIGDVRVALRRFREQMIANIENGVDDPHLNLNLEDCCELSV